MKSQDSKNAWSLEFLCWIDRCLFPDDFEKDLIELGGSRYVAFMMGDRLKRDRCGFVRLYQEYALHDMETERLLISYLDMMYTKWIEYQEKNK